MVRWLLFTLCSVACIASRNSKTELNGWPEIHPPINFKPILPPPRGLPPFHSPSLQSPIDIRSRRAPKVDLPDLIFQDMVNDGVRVRMINTGYTLEFVIADGSVMKPMLRGGPLVAHGVFEFNNLHIHWGTKDYNGGEHEINGRREPFLEYTYYKISRFRVWTGSPRELSNDAEQLCEEIAAGRHMNSARFAVEGHCVHFNTKYGTIEEASKHSDGLAVAAFFAEAGDVDNPKIERLVELLPYIKYPNTSVTLRAKDSLDWFAELAIPTHYFTYPGSLTTPPYSENVFWIVYPVPMSVSSRQVEAFRNLLSDDLMKNRENNRPLQPFNNRPLIHADPIK